MNKHLPHDLAQMQSLPLEAKIIMTQQRIRQWYEYWDGNVYVSFSGGKDSTVLKHIIDSMYGDVPAVFVNTGLEYPEIQKFVRDVKAGKYGCFNSDAEILRPSMRFDEVIKKYGYPVIGKKQADAIEYARSNLEQGKYSLRLKMLGVTTEQAINMGLKIPDEKMLARYGNTTNGSKFNFPKYKDLLFSDFRVSAKCCNEMKKKPAFRFQKETGKKPFLATMAHESMIRKNAWLKNGCNAFNSKHPASTPLAFWTEQDVLHYIKKYNVPYCSVYGDIVVDEKVDGNAVMKGQMNLIDYLGCYEETDKLKTTGCDRTGCMFCMFGCHLEKEGEGRFERMKQTHPKQYAYCMKPVDDGGLGLKYVIDWMNENCGTHIRY